MGEHVRAGAAHAKAWSRFGTHDSRYMPTHAAVSRHTWVHRRTHTGNASRQTKADTDRHEQTQAD
eukprot:6194704-Pleurochrysis_carterae.AAC.2